MKKVISFLMIAMVISTMAFSQKPIGIIFRGNTQQSIEEGEKINGQKGDFQFSLDLNGQMQGKLTFDSYDNGFSENIIEYQWYGRTLQVWAETAYYELHYAPSVAGKQTRPIMMLEFPYVGTIQYSQYWFERPVRPIMSNGGK